MSCGFSKYLPNNLFLTLDPLGMHIRDPAARILPLDNWHRHFFPVNQADVNRNDGGILKTPIK